MLHGSCAHGAGLKRDIQLAVHQPVVAEQTGRLAHRPDLGMGRGVVVGDRLVMSHGNHLTLMHHHGTDRHLAERRSLLGRSERKLHEAFIAVVQGLTPGVSTFRPAPRH